MCRLPAGLHNLLSELGESKLIFEIILKQVAVFVFVRWLRIRFPMFVS